ncbi:MAG: H/ACA ribonucleoprotein complex subunit GAR1 [Candidatus Methanomethylicaceae archaeon]
MVGSILHISRNRLITVKVSTPPKIGSRLFLKDGSPLGTVIDLFGPVSSPYASLKPTKTVDTRKIVGAEVYFKEEEFRRGRFFAKGSC